MYERWKRRSFVSISFFLVILMVLPAFPEPVSRTVASVRPDSGKILKARDLADQGKVDAAKALLEKAIEGEKSAERRALLRLTQGMIFYRAGKNAEAEVWLKASLDEGVRVPDYVHFYLGVLRAKLGKTKEARSDFEKVIANKATPGATANDARYELAQLHMAHEQWRLALNQLEYLRRRFRSDGRLPEVLFQMARANRKLGQLTPYCRHVRELYSKYPAFHRVQSWGPRLRSNEIDGVATGCQATNRDLKTRVRRLWLAGEETRAEAELKFLKDEEGDEGESSVDGLIVNHLISEGRSAEAMAILLSRYESNRHRPPYLLLLAKAASAAGEYQMSVAAYQRAYDLAPKAKNAVNSLFLAAFTSYQMQDYDGASRRFERLVRAYPRSRQARDSQWHLAWIRYLRGDYMGAAESFKALSQPPRRKSNRRRRGGAVASADLVAPDRVQYWIAMSYLKMGKSQDAVPIFQKLARDPSLGYYSILAYHRLLGIPGAAMPVEVESRMGLRRAENETSAPSEEELKEAAEASAEDAAAEYAQDIKDEESESETDSTDAETEEGSEAEAPPVLEAPPADLPPNFKDPRLVQKFERARDLNLVGLEDAARRELREIEKRARSAADRKLLMTEYAALGSYERSSYLGEVGFGTARLRTGLKGESRQYWEYAYPRAWDAAVQKASRSTSVSQELIWSIMRAESHFRFDAQSPVGALGLMQVMPFTGRKVADLLEMKDFDVKTLLIPETNIRLGSRYLQRLVEKFEGKVPLVAASYNAGPHRVYAWIRNFGTLDMDEFIEHIPFVETRNYVKRVARNFQIYGLLYRGRTRSMDMLIQPVGIRLGEPPPRYEIW